MSEFSWWLLIVGLVVGAGLVWLVLADSSRREADIEARELPAEAAWIAEAMADQGRPIDQSDAEEVLRLHRAYLAGPPPDEPKEGDEADERDEAGGPDEADDLVPTEAEPGDDPTSDRGEPAA